MRVGGEYLVRLYIDQQTGRVAATEKSLRNLTTMISLLKKWKLLTCFLPGNRISYEMIINNKTHWFAAFQRVIQKLETGEKTKRLYKKNTTRQ